MTPSRARSIHEFTLQNFVDLFTTEVYRVITIRTIATAAAVTVTCAVIAFPIAFYMARVASPRRRGLLVVAVVMPLWASYLVKVYAWRLIIAEDGVLNWAIGPIGLKFPGPGDLAVFLVFVYLWLPYMILPIYAGPRAHPRLAPGGLRGPRRAQRPDLPAGRPAARRSRRSWRARSSRSR